tara:strand:- start:88 stop:324 length:237 start_codon:yes stop_codon:yes gene_type:complete
VHPEGHGEVVAEQFSVTASQADESVKSVTAAQASESSGTEVVAVSVQVASVPLNKCVFSGQDKPVQIPLLVLVFIIGS